MKDEEKTNVATLSTEKSRYIELFRDPLKRLLEMAEKGDLMYMGFYYLDKEGGNEEVIVGGVNKLALGQITYMQSLVQESLLMGEGVIEDWVDEFDDDSED